MKTKTSTINFLSHIAKIIFEGLWERTRSINQQALPKGSVQLKKGNPCMQPGKHPPCNLRNVFRTETFLLPSGINFPRYIFWRTSIDHSNIILFIYSISFCRK
ncbi:hypothetical protein CIPAW_05G213000 [Carya illinoinensis]|uniref:Uncharacterized protein n=1 Tax=Carya illinoinensis TaxID=32201 RepID=A0A8T1QLK8_CARIL|nr:hypothetical protein CIPAW_05G213000 [Carya illinoinensis]